MATKKPEKTRSKSRRPDAKGPDAPSGGQSAPPAEAVSGASNAASGASKATPGSLSGASTAASSPPTGAPSGAPTGASNAASGATSGALPYRLSRVTSAVARGLAGPGVALLVVLCALAVYLSTLAPSVTTEDSGELVTAAATWGVAHPPGYPLYCLLLQPFVRVPFWSPAYGANLASAVLGALAAGGVTLIALRLGAPARFAAAGGLLWAFARDVWAQSVVAEVYTLNALLLVTIVLLVLRFSEERSMRDLYLAAGLFGLALANHYPLMLLALPALLVFVARRPVASPAGRPALAPGRAAPWSFRAVLTVLGLSVPGLALYAYLPLAAARHPPINWGDPSTWDRFWAHVSRAAYRKLELGHLSSARDKERFLALFFEILASQWTAPVLIVLGVLGVLRLRARPRERNLLLAIAALSGVGLTLLLNYEYEHENIQRVDEFYLPVYAVLAPVLAMGLAHAAEEIARRAPPLERAARVVLPAVFLLPLVLHHRHNDLSNDRVAHDYNAFVLDSLPPDSVYFTSGDYTSFPSLYFQVVEGRRPDVLLADFTGELSPAARAYLAEIDPSIDPGDRAAVQSAFIDRGRRKLLVAAKSDLKIAAPVDPWGLVYFVWGLPGGPGGRLPPLLSFPLSLPESIPGADGLLRSLIADYHLMRGEALFMAGNGEGARDAFKQAVAAQALSKETVNNVASTAADRRFLADAERWYLKAAALSPGYVTPRRNLARMFDTAGRREEAIEAYRELLRAAPGDQGAKARLDELLRARSAPPVQKPADSRVEELLAAIQREPGKPSLHNNLGNVYAEQGDPRRAREAYEKAIKADPTYALAYKNLAVLHRDLLHDPAAAERYLEKYRSLGGR